MIILLCIIVVPWNLHYHMCFLCPRDIVTRFFMYKVLPHTPTSWLIYEFSDGFGYRWSKMLSPHPSIINRSKPNFVTFSPASRTDPSIYTPFYAGFSIFGRAGLSCPPLYVGISYLLYMSQSHKHFRFRKYSRVSSQLSILHYSQLA